MEQLELEADKREIFGKKVRFLRRQGLTPANLYGHGVSSTALQIGIKPLLAVLSQAGETGLIALTIAGSKRARNTLVRGIQRDPRTDHLLHVDFYQVKMTEKIKTEVPLSFIGEAPAVKDKGGVLLHTLNSLHIEALPHDLPRSLEVDLSGLEEIDQALYAKDIPLEGEVTLLTDPEQMVVKVAEPRRAVVEEVEVAAEEEVAEAEAAAEAEGAPSPESAEETSTDS